MEPIQFIYWLQGYIEIADPKYLSEAQVKILKEKLQSCFEKKTKNHVRAEISAINKAPEQTYCQPSNSAPETSFPSRHLTGEFKCNPISVDPKIFDPKIFTC